MPTPLNYAPLDESRHHILNRIRWYLLILVIVQLLTVAEALSVIAFNAAWSQLLSSPATMLLSAIYYVLVPLVELTLLAALLSPGRIPLAPVAAAQVASVLIGSGVSISQVLLTGRIYTGLLELPPLLAALYSFQQAIMSAFPSLLVFILWRRDPHQGHTTRVLPRVVASACLLYVILPLILPLYAQYFHDQELFNMEAPWRMALSIERVIEFMFGITLIACAIPILAGQARSYRLLRGCAVFLIAGSALHTLLVLCYFQMVFRSTIVVSLYLMSFEGGLPFIHALCFALCVRDALSLPDLRPQSA